MPNLEDMASDTEQLFLDVSLKNARITAAAKGPTATGFCLNCDEPQPSGRRWCDRDCAADWEERVNAESRRKGRPTVDVTQFGDD